MRPDRFKNLKVFYVFFFLITIAVFCISCNKTNTKESPPQQSHVYTDTIVGEFYVRLHSPELGEHPGSWEGPVEIGRKKGEFTCRVDTSLIRGVRMGKKESTIIIDGFSGSELFEVELNVDSCSNAKEAHTKLIMQQYGQ
ncbi:MAG TPA: hypothetical protein VHP36_00755 [Chitinispirillaceae bacterium]|nr:hypothetical protein [Chitinispirillaceae bacterium]